MKNTVKTRELPLQRGTVCSLCMAILISVFVVTGCEEKVKYPIDIPFTEYSLEGISCQWTSFEPNKVIIINSDEKLRDYIACTDANYSKIDFSKYSLLLVRGGATFGIRYLDISLSKDAINEYSMNVSIHTDMTAVAPPWLVSIITPKIDDEATIMLNVQQINN